MRRKTPTSGLWIFRRAPAIGLHSIPLPTGILCGLPTEAKLSGSPCGVAVGESTGRRRMVRMRTVVQVDATVLLSRIGRATGVSCSFRPPLRQPRRMFSRCQLARERLPIAKRFLSSKRRRRSWAGTYLPMAAGSRTCPTNPASRSYVQAFSPSAKAGSSNVSGKWMVSKGSLGMARWRNDGKELAFISTDGGVMSVDVTGDPAFHASQPKLLFPLPRSVIALGGTTPGARMDAPGSQRSWSLSRAELPSGSRCPELAASNLIVRSPIRRTRANKKRSQFGTTNLLQSARSRYKLAQVA